MLSYILNVIASKIEVNIACLVVLKFKPTKAPCTPDFQYGANMEPKDG